MKHVKIAGGVPFHGSLSEPGAVDATSDSASLPANWQHFSDPLTNGERIIQAVSRAAGIGALFGGVIAMVAIVRFF